MTILNEIHASLIDKQYSISVYFDANGRPHMGNVQGFYTVDSNCYDILPVSSSIKLEISKALGISLKSRSKKYNRSSVVARQDSEQAL